NWIRRLLRVWADDGRTVVVSSHLLAEVAQVVDRVVVIRDGALVAETDLSELTDSVTVRVDQLEPMVRALERDGVDHEVLADGGITVVGHDPAVIGAIAVRAGVTVTELSRLSPGATLEAMFLSVTGSSAR